jgi:hypothetical protein
MKISQHDTSLNMKSNRYMPASVMACALVLAISLTPQLSFAQSNYGQAKANQPMPTVSLPLVIGWYKGQEVLYIQSEVSDLGVAVDQGVTYVPRLANVIPANGAPSGLDDIYVISNFKQGNIIPSAPSPTGPANTDTDYTPLWQVSVVTWVSSSVAPHLLRSEEEVFAARDQGLVTIDKKNIVVNCPVIYTPTGGLLPNAELHHIPGPKSPFQK